MPATRWLIRHELGHRWAACLVLVFIVASGSAGALVALGAADRTASAYGHHLRSANVGDLTINPSLASPDIDQVIRTLPGVRRATRDVLFLADMVEARPMTREQFDAEPLVAQVRGSADGRYLDMDRPALHAGRLAAGPQEAFVTADLAEAQGIEVGDVVPVSFAEVSYEFLDEPTDIVTPIAVEWVTVVGIGTLADEVLPDGVYPRGRIIVSPDVAARYDCTPAIAPPEASFEELLAIMLPSGCAAAYPYYSLDVAGGADGVAEAVAAFTRAAEVRNAELPDNVTEVGAGYYPILTTTGGERERVERSVQPTVTALGVLAAGTAAVTLVVVGLAVARQVRRAEGEQRDWWRIGLAARDRAAVVIAPLVASTGVGLGGALLVAWLASPVAPIGSVGAVDPNPGRWLSGWVVAGAGALAALHLAIVGALVLRSVRRVGALAASQRPVPALQRIVRPSNRPEVDEGLRAAFARSRGAGLVVASGGVSAGVFLAAVVFGSSLSAVVSAPAAYGWPWDVAVMGGFGYGGQDVDAVGTSLEHRDDVDGWTGLGFGLLDLDGEPVVTITGLGQPGPMDVTVASGRLPVGDEVALGARTADERGLGIGDEVALSGDGLSARPVTVSGIVVLPALGPFQSDRAAPGRGMVLPAGLLPGEVTGGAISFIGIDLVEGVDRAGFLDDLRDDFAAWAVFGDLSLEYPVPVRPPEIVDAAGMRAVPLVVGGMLAVGASAGLMFAVAVSVRARRRELATLRALGFSGRQLRTSVSVQATAMMGAALAIGVPLGVVVGRVSWQSFAGSLGVLPDPTVPLVGIAATVVGGLAVALAVAALPGRAAARASAGTVLRST